ncbi:MAG: EAL domain-containing protein [Actinomycetales bacterium]|nr:EAL domain-containing protein [Actinomycetales bacterium]
MDAREGLWGQSGLESRAAAWLDGSPDPFACLDDELRLLYANAAFTAATGCSSATCAGRPLIELRPFGEATEAVAALAVAVRDRPEQDLVEDELAWHPAGTTAERRHVVRVRAEREPGGGRTLILLTTRDVTQFREAEQALRDREAEFRTLAENTPDNIIRYDLNGYATYCNPAFEQRVNTTVDLILGRRPVEAGPAGMTGAEEYERLLMRALRTGAPGRVEVTVLRPDGVRATHSVLIRAECGADGSITGALAIGRDVSDLVEARQAATEREREFRSLAENAGDQIARWDTHGRFVYANPRMLGVLGLPADQVYGRSIAEVAPGRFDAASQAIARVLAGGPAEMVDQRFVALDDGLEHVHEILCVPEHGEGGALVSVLGVGRDITESVHHRDELERMARTDLLTGLPNSKALYDRAPGMLEAATRSGRRAAVLLLDLDAFKSVNDTLGHAGGDQVLRDVADRVRACLRSYDLFVRLGGDEFMIVIEDLDTPQDLVALGDKVLQALTQQHVGAAARTSASIGVAVYPEDGDTIETLIMHADIAMYQAKRAGRGRVEYFRPELSTALQRRAAIERALDDPDLASQLQMHVQPVFLLGPPRRLSAAEALLRWQHPTLGAVGPDEFIPIAEETGAIVRIGRWVLNEATRSAARWNRGRSEVDTVAIAVNFSTRQFLLDDIGGAVDEALGANGCAPTALIAEITENLLLEDSGSVQAALTHLRGRGVRIAIDDFGTGYSALNYLTRFPLDVLKIDRSFVRGLGTGVEHDELLKALVALARTLGLRTVAEGIETPAQLAFLAAQGCEFAQGFLLGRPMPVDQFEAEYLGPVSPPGT